MPEPTETSGRPLAQTTTNEKNQPKANTINPFPSTTTNHSKSSQPSDDSSKASKSTNPRRRPGITIKAPYGPHAGSSRSEQRSTISPTNTMSQSPSINYTRTGRISKAKKGLKVHDCECGRSYTRAEHLRRHQKNHTQDDILVCDFPDCGKPFFRVDLLQRHRERHNEPSKDSEGSPELPQVSLSGPIPTSTPAPSQPSSFYLPTQSVPLLHETPTRPRYTFNPFRTPQIPRTPRLPSSGSIPRTSPTSCPNNKQPTRYTANTRPIPMPVALDGMTPPTSWAEPYNQSPSYSPSSSYDSPNPGHGDYANVFANTPYGYGANRTRTSSIASYTEPWYTPHSPTSTASTMWYAWPNDKATNAPYLASIDPSYSMASPCIGYTSTISQMAGDGQFSPKTMMQRDEDEEIILFSEPYGMGQIAHTYPSEQYLNNYWRLFHPTFPIVHRFTFENMSQSPMLHAAMIALGGQYSNDTSVKQKSRILHDRCIKLFEKRDREPMAEPNRLCDYQAVFLVEMLSQYRSRRAAKSLSPRFGTLYHKAAESFRQKTSQLNDIVISLNRHENVTLTNWFRWIELSTWQRLLVSCYTLESQQAMLLAREPIPSLFKEGGLDLPFPVHTFVWDAESLNDWVIVAQQYLSSPHFVYEVTQESVITPCDSFQSAILVATHYNSFNATLPYTNAPSIQDIDHIIDNSFITKQKLLTAKLLQVTPIRALLAVSGESWILSEKVPSQQAFTMMKTTLHTWVAQIWSATATQSQKVASKEASRLSIEILQLALNEHCDPSTLNMGTDMGVYFAALVLWVVTTAASTRMQKPPQAAQDLHSPNFFHSHNSLSVPSTPTQVAKTSSPTQPTMLGLVHNHPTPPARQDSLTTTTLLPHGQITFNLMSYLPVILDLVSDDPTSHNRLDLNSLQVGCISMLHWVKLLLRGVPLDNQTDMAVWASSPGEGLGELLDSVVGSLERILNRGWSGWGV
ncbi:hypothetical protein GQ44DRAFT_776288 [Phaeosphaeriaceae sp. PMI808]|nr:hypothetical protein GQ44DRAFT_776288 [Phaeosphaeriaceae sp. PMI808]